MSETKFTPSPDVKNILITGGAGFMCVWQNRWSSITNSLSVGAGSWGILHWHTRFFTTLFASINSICASLNNRRLLNAFKNFTFVLGDITNPADIMNCLTTYKIDILIRFAAQSHVDLNFGLSYRFTDTNVYGTHVLLESAKEAKVARFIHVSTDEVHGEPDEKSRDYSDEKRIHAPINSYAASKAAAEMFVHAYQKSYNIPAIVVRMNKPSRRSPFPRRMLRRGVSRLMLWCQ